MACVLLKSVSWFAILKYCLGLPVVRFLLLDLARHIQFTKVYINRFINIYIYTYPYSIFSLGLNLRLVCLDVSHRVLLCPPLSSFVPQCPRLCLGVLACPRTAGTHVPACPRRSRHVPALLGHMSPRVPAGPCMSPHVLGHVSLNVPQWLWDTYCWQ